MKRAVASVPEQQLEEEEEESVNSPKRVLLEEPESPLRFTSPDALFASLIAPFSPEQFFREHWEKKPLHLHRDDPTVARFYRSLFSLSDLPDLCKCHALQFYRDVNAVRCVNGKKKVLNREGRVRSEVLTKLISQNKATVQFHQPQRFKDALWQIQEKMESFFGALVGSNVYLTPPESQGLPPHYDDVEVFILQLEGQKQWRLYSPPVPLAAEYSLVPEERLGSPTHQILMQEGDLLYFPRGTVHQAHTLPGAPSTHLTISTYQKMAWSDLLLDVLPGLLGVGSRSEEQLRQGLPPRLLLGSFECENPRKLLAAHLRHLAERVETGTGEMCCAGLKRDFITNRLPPYGPKELLEPVGRLPQLQDSVCLTFREHMLLSVEPTERTTDEAPEMTVFVLHSLRNQRGSHMMSVDPQESEGDEEGPHVSSGLQFPLSHLEALQQLQREEKVSVSELRLSSPEEQLSLVVALWSESLLKAL